MIDKSLPQVVTRTTWVPVVANVVAAEHYKGSDNLRRIMLWTVDDAAHSFPDIDGKVMDSYFDQCTLLGLRAITSPVQSYPKGREHMKADIKADIDKLFRAGDNSATRDDDRQALLQRCWDFTVSYRSSDLFDWITRLEQEQ